MGNSSVKEPVWPLEKNSNENFRLLRRAPNETFLRPATESKEIKDEELYAKYDRTNSLSELNNISKNFCEVTPTTATGTARADEKYNIPDWRTHSEIVWDPINEIELLYVPVGSILFKGTSINTANQSAKSPLNGYYGTFNTAFNYAFQSWETYDSGEIAAYVVKRPIHVVYISTNNLLNLMNIEAKDPSTNEIEKESLRSSLRYMFTFRYNPVDTAKKPFFEQENELRRRSNPGTDFEFLNWLYERRFQGYGYRRMLAFNQSAVIGDRSHDEKDNDNDNDEDKHDELTYFHSEITLCDAPSYLEKLPVEWRMFETYPKCLFQFYHKLQENEGKKNEKELKLMKILDASKFGDLGWKPERWKVRGPFINNNDDNNIRKYLTEIDRYVINNINTCNCLQDKRRDENINERIEYSNLSALDFQTDANTFPSELFNNDNDNDEEYKQIYAAGTNLNENWENEALEFFQNLQMRQLTSNIMQWNERVVNALKFSYHLIPSRHYTPDNLNKAWQKYINYNQKEIIHGCGGINNLFFNYLPDNDNDNDNDKANENQNQNQHQHQIFTVMTWNIHLWGRQNIHSTEKINVISKVLPDVLCLQEVGKETLDYLAFALRPFGYLTKWITYCTPVITQRQTTAEQRDQLINVIFVRKSKSIVNFNASKNNDNTNKEDDNNNNDNNNDYKGEGKGEGEGERSEEGDNEETKEKHYSNNNTNFYGAKAIDLFHNAYGQEGRCAVYQKVGPFWIFNLHLDVYDSTNFTRINQISDILTIVNNSIPTTDPVLVMGDFNSIRKRDIVSIPSQEVWLKNRSPYGLYKITDESFVALELLQNLGNFQDVSDFLNINIPVTVWTGTRVDFIFARNISREHILSTFTVFTAASDHLPLVAQFYFSNLSNLSNLYNLSKYGNHVFEQEEAAEAKENDEREPHHQAISETTTPARGKLKRYNNFEPNLELITSSGGETTKFKRGRVGHAK